MAWWVRAHEIYEICTLENGSISNTLIDFGWRYAKNARGRQDMLFCVRETPRKGLSKFTNTKQHVLSSLPRVHEISAPKVCSAVVLPHSPPSRAEAARLHTLPHRKTV